MPQLPSKNPCMYQYQTEATLWWYGLTPLQKYNIVKLHTNGFKYYQDTASKVIYMYRAEVIYRPLISPL